jgi:hypothetical protein
MKPVDFKSRNFVLGAPPGQEESVQALPCYFDGSKFVSVWELTDEELEIIKQTKLLFFSVCGVESKSAVNQKPRLTAPPILPSVYSLVPENGRVLFDVWYRQDGRDSGVWIWVSEDVPIPKRIGVKGEMYHYAGDQDPRWEDKFRPNKQLQPGDFFFKKPSQVEIDRRLDSLSEKGIDSPEYLTELTEAAAKIPVLCRIRIVGSGYEVYG